MSSCSASSAAFTPRCLLLHSIATFALMIAVLAPRSLALAVAVLAPLSLALAVAALACQRARRRDRLGIGLGLLGVRSAVVLHQLLLEVLVAAKVREEQLVLRVQRRALAKDAKVEVVGRLDEASAAAPASGHRDEDMGRRYGFIQLDDRDVDRGRQARHKWDLEAAHRLVFVDS